MKGMTIERMAQACNARLCGAPMKKEAKAYETTFSIKNATKKLR